MNYMSTTKSKQEHISIQPAVNLSKKRVSELATSTSCTRCKATAANLSPKTLFCAACQSEYEKYVPDEFNRLMVNRITVEEEKRAPRFSLSQDARLKSKSKKKSKKRMSFSVTTSKTNNTLKLPPNAPAEVFESFRYAFFTKNMTYCSRLIYDSHEATEEMNNA